MALSYANVSHGSYQMAETLTSTRESLYSFRINFGNLLVIEPPPLAVFLLSLSSDWILGSLLLNKGCVVTTVSTGALVGDDTSQLVETRLHPPYLHVLTVLRMLPGEQSDLQQVSL